MSERLLDAREVAEWLGVPVSWNAGVDAIRRDAVWSSAGIGATTARTSRRGSRRASGPAGRSAYWWRVDNEPFRQSPFVLEEQHALELREAVGAVVERPKDCFSVGDRERDDPAFAVVGVFERFGGVVESLRAEALREFEHQTVGDVEACQKHGVSSLLLCRASCDRPAKGLALRR